MAKRQHLAITKWIPGHLSLGKHLDNIDHWGSWAVFPTEDGLIVNTVPHRSDTLGKHVVRFQPQQRHKGIA